MSQVPSITAIEPDQVRAGKDKVDISGSNLATSKKVTLTMGGDTKVVDQIHVDSPRKIHLYVPEGTAVGSYEVTVTTTGGTSNSLKLDVYTPTM